MYTYKRAVGVNQLIPRGVELLDIATVPTKELFGLYRSLTLVVTDELAQRDVSIDAYAYFNELMAFTGTIQAWLTTQSAVVLKTSNKLPGDKYRFVTTHDIQYEWFTLFPGDARISEDRQALLTKAAAKDIRVIKTDRTQVDYKALLDCSLWTINGHMVRAIEGDDSLYLINAGRHYNVNDNAHVNCLNFNTVSTLKTYPVTKENLFFEGHETFNYLHLKSPVSLKGKSVWMSIGGRLCLTDVVQQNSEYGITINAERVDWFTRIFDSKQFIDLSSVIDKDREVVGKDFFTTEAFFTALMLDPSTFFIVLDNPDLYVSMEAIAAYNYPFTYHTEELKRVPLMLGNGMLPKYNVRKIINRRLLDIDIGNQKRYLNYKTGINNEGDLYHGFTNRFSPSTLHRGYLLYIRGLIQGI